MIKDDAKGGKFSTSLTSIAKDHDVNTSIPMNQVEESIKIDNMLDRNVINSSAHQSFDNMVKTYSFILWFIEFKASLDSLL